MPFCDMSELDTQAEDSSFYVENIFLTANCHLLQPLIWLTTVDILCHWTFSHPKFDTAKVNALSIAIISKKILILLPWNAVFQIDFQPLTSSYRMQREDDLHF